MSRLLALLCGRLAALLVVEAFVGLSLSLGAVQIWSQNAVYVTYMLTVMAMVLTCVAQHEKLLAGNVGWLMSLPLAKAQVWHLVYAVKMGSVLFGLALLLAVAWFLPGHPVADGTTTRLVEDIFHDLYKAAGLHFSFFAGGPADPADTPVKGATGFIMLFGLAHFYASMTGITVRQRRAGLITGFVALIWFGSTMVTILVPSQFSFELFFIGIAVAAAILGVVFHLHVRARDTWTVWPVLLGGWALILVPQVGSAVRGVMTGPSMDRFVEGQQFFGSGYRPGQHRFKAAFRMPGSSWALTELVRLRTGTSIYEEATLSAEGDPVFDFGATLKAQTDLGTVYMLPQVVVPASLTQAHLTALFARLAALETKAAAQPDNRYGSEDSELVSMLAVLVRAQLPEDQLVAWLRHKSAAARRLAIVYPRFHPGLKPLRAVAAGIGSLDDEEQAMARDTIAILTGGYLEAGEALPDLSGATVLTDRSVCRVALRRDYCGKISQCEDTSPRGRAGCWRREGVDPALLNACLPVFALAGHRHELANLIASGWVDAANDFRSNPAHDILCPGGYRGDP